MAEFEGFGDLSEQAAELERVLGSAETVTGAFTTELSQLRDSMVFTSREVGSLSRSFGSTLRSAFDGVVFDGMKLSDALAAVGQRMSASMYSAAMKPVQNAAGTALASGLNAVLSGVLPFAQGGVVSSGRVQAFAKGGVVSQPTRFAMRGGTGLMGEAGPEAIMPLARGADGRLGVQASAGRSVNVVMNITTPDAPSFQRSQSQVAAQLSRALARGQRNG
ncbi:phage tail protein [Thioclava sp. SK-1]|uniref:phage tail tape measure protein n=1 Tax=Thioclava sp. SK-1 TaxID=1889770 RepID=UPI0008250B66|nr:phage tail tape measure protein [Thioclava sp. SK-1]OCX67041.1 phage tail protein [Thioclava sp. SK-1]